MRNIVIYSKDYCPYCNAAKSLLKEKGWSFTDIEVGYDSALFAEMVERSGRRTVPQIFNEYGHIGGLDDLVKRLDNVERHTSAA
ncbi:MAG: glutaredoxin 3 [Candidatus Endobugula sp.]|jgi:glutaredoxin 3